MRLQRNTAFVTSAFGLMLCCASAHSQQKPPLTITISGPRTIPAGSDLTIHIVTTNVSDQSVQICSASEQAGTVEVYYKVAIHDEKGEEPPITDFGRRAKTSYVVQENARTLCEWPPNWTLAYSMAVSKQYDLSKPGKYIVQVTRAASDLSPNSTVVKSNELTVTVVPKQPDALPFTLTIEGPASVTAAEASAAAGPGNPIRVDAELRNISHHAVVIVWGTLYIVRIHTEDGQQARPRSGLVNGESLKYVSLAPGQTSYQPVAVSTEYDLTKPGDYIVQLLRPMDDAGYPEGSVVESNEWIITVLPDRHNVPQ